MALELHILSLNVWGIPFISLNRVLRVQAITSELAKGTYDIVSLQEVWSEDDYQYIKDKTSHVLPFTHYFYSGVFGSGLCLFSKYPITSTFFHSWAVNGYAHRIHHGDWFGGKGVGLCRVLINNQPVNVYIAHLHAEYDPENDEYRAHRIIQAFDTAQFIESTRSDSILQILAGDLNTEPNDIAYKVLTKSSKLIDCCEENVGTNKCENNSYTPLVVAKQNPVGKRIDHILIHPGDNYEVSSCKYRLPFANRVPGQSFSYSDHEAISVQIKIIKKNQYESITHKNIKLQDLEVNQNNTCGAGDKSDSIENYEIVAALEDCVSVCDFSLQKLKTDRIVYFSMAIFVTFLLIAMMDFLPPYGMKTIYLIMKFLLSGIVLFLLFMATIWNVMERHGILAGKLSMEIALQNYKKNFL